MAFHQKIRKRIIVPSVVPFVSRLQMSWRPDSEIFIMHIYICIICHTRKPSKPKHAGIDKRTHTKDVSLGVKKTRMANFIDGL